MLGIVVCTVQFAGRPVKVKLTLRNAVFEPVVAHVEGFRLLHADLSVKDPMGSGVVSFKRSARCGLPVAHFFKCGEDGDSRLCIEKQGTGFGFRGGGGDAAECFAKDVDGPVGLGIGRGGCR
jgi:hypothetical protein